MRIASLLCLCLVIGAINAADKDAKVEYTQYPRGYFEKNTSGLKGESSYLVITDKAKFDEIFSVGFTMGPKPVLLPSDKDELAKLLVIAAIKRGNSLTTYEIKGVTVADGVVTVDYKATAGPAGSATFASPMILSIPKDKVKKIIFNENGKKAHEEAVK